ncbi:TraR/DksA C4-type zinc finger protein [Undibacterium sp. TJN25]|uniref:TraR/DksA C4-type zinc finger protein n=1 Tax=Undibacterium sp. TJN25 TaxID=3413056 RepID=UPI003BF1EF2B
MTDIFDRAAELELLQRQDALARLHTQALARQAAAEAPSAAECEECDQPIPAERQTAAPGCTRCTHCQQALEARCKLTRP